MSILSQSKIRPGVCRSCGRQAAQIEYQGHLVPGVYCQECREAIERQIACEDRERQQAIERAYKDRTRQLFEQSNLGAKFERATFENWKKRPGTEEAFMTCRKWAREWPHQNGRGVVISGPTGSGKTHLAAAVTHVLLERGVEVIFQSVPDLLLKIRSTFNRGSEVSEEQIIRRLVDAELVVLDDLGAEKMTDWTETTLYNLIDQRYRHERPAIITTNLGLNELGGRIGPRTMDRLAESYTHIKLDTNSYRRAK